MMKSSCRAGLHREPLNSTSSTVHHVKRSQSALQRSSASVAPPADGEAEAWGGGVTFPRVTGMHLKPYLKLQKRERSLEISQDSLRAPHMNHQRLPQEKYTNNCTKLSILPKPSSATPSRKVLGILYPNTMCNTSGKPPAEGPSPREKKSTLSATIHQGDEGEGPLDVWAVVKPGNTKEKIAFFAAQQCSNNRLGSMKIKSTWDIDGRAAKRRKKSIDLKKAKIQLERMREANTRCSQPEPFACGIEHCSVHYVNENGDGIVPGRSLSVIEMVAFLEQRASALLVDCTKNCTNATSTRLTGQPKGAPPASDPFSAVGTCEEHPERDACGTGEQNEPVRVLDMVAKLESECLRRQSEREAGSLSRNNSFRRNVGRVLLATSTPAESETAKASSEALDQEVSLEDPATAEDVGQRTKCGPLVDSELWEVAASEPQSLPVLVDACTVNTDFELVQDPSAAASSRYSSERLREPLVSPPSACPKAAGLPPPSLQSKSVLDVTGSEVQTANPRSPPVRKESLCISISATKSEKGCRKDQLFHLSSGGEDSLPGRLFFPQPARQTNREHKQLREGANKTPQAAAQREDASEDDSVCVNSISTELFTLPVALPESALQVLDPSCLKKQVSHDFLETRFKIQQLLEPQQYMAFLPHHIMVKIFGLLPTRSLVALKCTCYYFKFIIEYYNIRPADSRWVRDPRYREDPCKQCKKTYVKGDVSLCRWHPKPYCQALPYGPGYWMCCHRSQKGIPGCKLGLHDNRWVPACHSFNRAIHKKSRGAESEEEY